MTRSSPAPRHILVCDSNEEARAVLSALFRHHGFQVTAAETAAGARRLASVLLPDLLITETVLDDGEGVELIEAVRRNQRTAWIPTAVLTSRMLKHRRQACLEAGADRFLTRPIPPLDLLAHAEELTRRDRRSPGSAGEDASRLVLLVDDDGELRAVLREGMEGLGVRVEQARTGEEGVALAAALAPDLIFMNLVMPRLDGWNAARILRRSPRTTGIPVVLMSAHSTSARSRRLQDAGFHAVLQKPFAMADALEIVREMPRNGEAWS